jgi:hypothetical protein
VKKKVFIFVMLLLASGIFGVKTSADSLPLEDPEGSGLVLGGDEQNGEKDDNNDDVVDDLLKGGTITTNKGTAAELTGEEVEEALEEQANGNGKKQPRPGLGTKVDETLHLSGPEADIADHSVRNTGEKIADELKTEIEQARPKPAEVAPQPEPQPTVSLLDPSAAPGQEQQMATDTISVPGIIIMVLLVLILFIGLIIRGTGG